MKSSILLAFVAFSLAIIFSACPNDVEEALPYPDCMQTKIDSILAMPVLNPPGLVEQWSDEGKTYYYLSGGCCDFFSNLYDEDCQFICAPDGGITGMGDGNCPRFTDELKSTQVWVDPRK